MHVAQLQAAIARDSAYLAKMKTSGSIANTNGCRAPKARTLRVACDLLAKTDELNATLGLMEIVVVTVPLAVNTVAQFGTVSGPAVAQTIVNVLPKSKTRRPIPRGGNVIGPNTRSFTLTVGQRLVIHTRNTATSTLSGFNVTPALGILQVTPGPVHVQNLEYSVLNAVGSGTVTVRYYGPTVTTANGFCSRTNNNWSGYMLLGGPFVGITGTWVVPTIPSNSSSGMSSTWIGLDGCASVSGLIQTGTEQDIAAGFFAIGGTSYSAWWENISITQFNPSQNINNVVLPGDLMTSSITPQSFTGPDASGNITGSWVLTLTDVSGGWSFSVSQNYTGPLSSAEWIEEATSVCVISCAISALADYQTVTFDDSPGTLSDAVTVMGSTSANPALSSSDQVNMVPGSGGNNTSTPSNPDCDTDGFTVVPSLVQPPPPGPVFASIALLQAVVGTPYSQLVQIAGASQISWSPTAVTFAPGVVFNSGTIGGTPTSPGSYNLALTASNAANTAQSCAASLALTVGASPAPSTPTPQTFNSVTITILTGNDDMRNDSDLQVNFTGVTGWPGQMCLVQGNSQNVVSGSACTGGTPGDWNGPNNNWGGYSAWSQVTETKNGLNLQWTGAGSMTFTFTTHNTGCSNPFGGCGSANDNWDIQAMSVVLNPGNVPLFSVGNFNSPHKKGQCFWRVKPPGGTDPSSISIPWTFPPNPSGNGCPADG